MHRIFDRVIFYGLLATIVVTAIPYGSVQSWWTALFECVIFVLAILAIVDLTITRDRFPEGASIALPLVLLCLFIVVQSLPLFASGNPVIPNLRLSISADPFSTQQLAMKLLALILAGVLLLRYANTEARLRALVYVVIGVGVASALFGLLRHETGGPSWFFPLPANNRGFAQFVNRNHFGYLMEMTIGLVLGLVIRTRATLPRLVVFLPIAIFLWVTLIFSNTRGGIFASFCQLLFVGILLDPIGYLRRDRDTSAKPVFHRIGAGLVTRSVAAVALGIVFLLGVNWVGGERVATNIEMASTAYDQPPEVDPRQNTWRKQIWSATWQMFKAHPIVGTGLGAYWIAITKYHDASGEFTPQEAHNDYLELLASGGLTGCALVLWLVVRLAGYTRDSITHAGSLSAPAFGALVGIFGVLVHSFVDFGLHITANALVFTILIVVLVQTSGLSRGLLRFSDAKFV